MFPSSSTSAAFFSTSTIFYTSLNSTSIFFFRLIQCLSLLFDSPFNIYLRYLRIFIYYLTTPNYPSPLYYPHFFLFYPLTLIFFFHTLVFFRLSSSLPFTSSTFFFIHHVFPIPFLHPSPQITSAPPPAPPPRHSYLSVVIFIPTHLIHL